MSSAGGSTMIAPADTDAESPFNARIAGDDDRQRSRTDKKTVDGPAKSKSSMS